ncbi:MAG: hypothetical protein AB9917_13565 [Negativicutes bacterium]
MGEKKMNTNNPIKHNEASGNLINPDSKKTFWSSILASILASAITSIIVFFSTSYMNNHLFAKQEYKEKSELSIDDMGVNALKWEFIVQPERKTSMNDGKLMGCYLHLETAFSEIGNLIETDLSKYQGIKFKARSSQPISVTEFNLFVGEPRRQYLYKNKTSLTWGTEWNEYDIRFDELSLAPWSTSFNSEDKALKQAELSRVTAFGWDLKTSSEPVNGTIWINNIRLIDKHQENIQTVIGANRVELFQGAKLFWRSGCNKYQ